MVHFQFKKRRKLNTFAEKSKRRVEKIVKEAIKLVDKWKLDMLAKIDVTHQHILRMDNLQNANDCHAESEKKHQEKTCDIFPSMPSRLSSREKRFASDKSNRMNFFLPIVVLVDENCNDFNDSPSKPIHSSAVCKIVKRRNTVCSASSAAIAFDAIPMRKNSRFAYCSAAKEQLNVKNTAPVTVESATLTHAAKCGGKQQNV